MRQAPVAGCVCLHLAWAEAPLLLGLPVRQEVGEAVMPGLTVLVPDTGASRSGGLCLALRAVLFLGLPGNGV